MLDLIQGYKSNPVVILGGNGSMGRRYQAVLKYLKVPYLAVDIGSWGNMDEVVENTSRVIIATPTERHIDHIRFFNRPHHNIFCEKPISTEPGKVEQIVSELKCNLSMSLQYSVLTAAGSVGPSLYDYYNHGKDGLLWDCFQIIALATGEVSIKETSPIWRCTLNGLQLSLSDMDLAYIESIRRWLSYPGQNLDEIVNMHWKVFNYGKQHGLN